MSIVAGIMVPHPPLIVPQVGRGEEREVQGTIDAYREAAAFLVASRPDVLVVTSPHAPLYRDAFQVSPGMGARGDFGRFGAPEVSFHVAYDAELASAVLEEAQEAGLPAVSMPEPGMAAGGEGVLDHGTMVPLYFIREAYRAATLDPAASGAPGEIPVPIVRIGLSGLSLKRHFELGRSIARAAERLGRRVGFVGSGDLSHKLQPDGPYGFDPAGPAYDERIMDVMGRAAFAELLDFDEAFCRQAAECGHRSFTIMAGAMEGCDVRARTLSHEDVTGVGYGVVLLEPIARVTNPTSICHTNTGHAPEDPYVRLARLSLSTYVRTGQVIDVPDWVPDEMLQRRAGAFVSLHRQETGELRGCIGTIAAVQENLAEEVVANAISAATRDPRFPAVQAGELDGLEVNVDVLGPMEPIDGPEALDPKRFGVVVTSGWRRGLLLPDLDGVDTVEQQVGIALRKAGIVPSERYSLERFEVVRHT